MYNDIESCVTVNNEVYGIPDYFVSHRGIKQGKKLYPLLFAMYVNDLEEF